MTQAANIRAQCVVVKKGKASRARPSWRTECCVSVVGVDSVWWHVGTVLGKAEVGGELAGEVWVADPGVVPELLRHAMSIVSLAHKRPQALFMCRVRGLRRLLGQMYPRKDARRRTRRLHWRLRGVGSSALGIRCSGRRLPGCFFITFIGLTFFVFLLLIRLQQVSHGTAREHARAGAA
jgi:hypothetical protein